MSTTVPEPDSHDPRGERPNPAPDQAPEDTPPGSPAVVDAAAQPRAPHEEVARLAAGIAHELRHPAEVLSSNGHTMTAYADVLLRLCTAYDAFLAAFGEQDRGTMSEQMRRITALREKEDVAFIVEDLGQLVAESRESTLRLCELAERLRRLASSPEEIAAPERLAELVDDTLRSARAA